MNLREELQVIYDKYGKLTAELVVEEARPTDHPLHDRVFDRGRKDAADAWYLHRADELIRSVKITYRDSEGQRLDMRAFTPVRPEQAGVYDPLDVIVKDDKLMTLLLARMEREWKDMKRRYDAYEQFWVMVKEDVA